MAVQAWKVRLHEARTQTAFARDRIAADAVEVFGVQADGPDAAKLAARKWLTDRGHSIRAVNVSSAEERTLIAYVAAGSVERSRQPKKLGAAT